MSDGLWRATVATRGNESQRRAPLGQLPKVLAGPQPYRDGMAGNSGALGGDGALPRGDPQLVRGEAPVSGDVGEQAPGVVLAAVVRAAEDTG